MPTFAYTILYVTDVKRSVDFYSAAFGLQQKFISDDHSYAEMLSGETTLSLASHKLANSNLSEGFIESTLRDKPFGMELGFAADDVEETLANAEKAGATVIEKPKTKPWGQTVAYARDPDGFLLEICTPM